MVRSEAAKAANAAVVLQWQQTSVAYGGDGGVLDHRGMEGSEVVAQIEEDNGGATELTQSKLRQRGGSKSGEGG
jgi:hypothetical protein